MTRIITGDARGVALAVPKSGTRPTSDRVREALFSSLDARGVLDGAAVLDLYAGTGALGLEALSRGAAEAWLVEKAPKAAGLLRRNASAVAEAIAGRGAGRGPGHGQGRSTGQGTDRGRQVRAHVVTASALSFAERDGGEYDLVFADPPYDVPNDELEKLLAALQPRLTPGALVVLERSGRSGAPSTPPGLELEQTKRYGDTVMLFYVAAEAAGG